MQHRHGDPKIELTCTQSQMHEALWLAVGLGLASLVLALAHSSCEPALVSSFVFVFFCFLFFLLFNMPNEK